MAKKAKGNKSLAIRDYKAANPDASPKAIAEALSSLKVTPQFVSTVLSNAKKAGGKIGKRGPKPGRQAATGGSLEQLLKAKKMIEQLGGIDNARSALNVLAQLGLG